MRIVFLIVYLFSTLWVQGQVTYFPYIYAIGKDSAKTTYEYGYYYQIDGNFKKQKLHIDEEIWIDNIEREFSKLDKSNQNVLFFIHGLWADKDQYFINTMENLNKDVYSSGENPYGMVISLKWSSTFGYENNQQLANLKGRQLADFISKIVNRLKHSNPDLKISFLCHSMGNQVFKSLYLTLKNSLLMPQIENLILAAPDLDYDVFDEGNDLSDVCNIVTHAWVLHNWDDKVLAFSTQMNKKLRLGQISATPKNMNLKCIHFYNAYHDKDLEGWKAKMNNHRYFYDSPNVRKFILETLSTSERNP
ncbi:MAG: alpha/beta hydrolase [Saprospiraceae bacterium]|nr:alpha/beta hydrolase [Saprospiraceae bacterium]MCB9328786.1 alpha/beta hydrolase [Lewinellaceae bacterium]